MHQSDGEAIVQVILLRCVRQCPKGVWIATRNLCTSYIKSSLYALSISNAYGEAVDKILVFGTSYNMIESFQMESLV